MHLLATREGSLDDETAAIDLRQTPAAIVLLSFSDSDLEVTSAAHAADPDLPTMRLVRLADLKHPFSVDLYIPRLAVETRLVIVRLLGGLDYWRYGVDELAAAARRVGFALAIVPGDDREDDRLDAASTLPAADLRRLWRWFQEGGADNVGACLRWAATIAGTPLSWHEPAAVPAAGRFEPGCRAGLAGAPHALILVYRSLMLADDAEPVTALADALAARGAAVTSLFVTSLKDAAAQATVLQALETAPPDIILNTTAFSARRGGSGAVTDGARVPVLQVVLSTATQEAWTASGRGLGAADLAMNVVLPEVDGRILAGALSFKAEAPRNEGLEFTRLAHRADPSRVAHVADLASAWMTLRRTPRAERRLACILSDYPGRGGRTGYAVGLDTPASLLAIADHLRQESFDIGPLPEARALMQALTDHAPERLLTLAAYEHALKTLPQRFVASVQAAWGPASDDQSMIGDAFAFRVVRAGKLVVAVQPDRGAAADRRADYHDTSRPPRHAYVAFYLWLRSIERIHALVHLGTHGTLEWLPGKAVALGPDCAPEAVLGPVPVIYPFIVNNPGEAAQAKRRIGAVTIGHMTPPLTDAGSHGPAIALEALFDEYAEALALDGRRAKLLGAAILEKAGDSGLAVDSGITAGDDDATALGRLDAWLCDLKEMRIGDGLHIFGADLDLALHRPSLTTPGASESDLAGKLARCGRAELRRLVSALDGGFVQPGPSGAPARGRLDVLPTGRNLFAIDPRGVPTRTAWDLGQRMAIAVTTRYAQDHGDWPRRMVLDLWGSATMRTGGDDLAQAFALIGAKPRWDPATGRVLGFEILPQALLDRPRVDVTLRISGLFRDTFPDQIALFDAATRAVAALDETDDENALAAHRRTEGTLPPRIFGAAPGHYGIGIGRTIMNGTWSRREELGEAYLAATSHAYGSGEGRLAPEAFRAEVTASDLYLHVQDLPGTDLLDAGPHADHEGGFAAAAAALGKSPALYHADTTRPDKLAVRSLLEEIARVVRGRATHPRWIAGQMRHGFRGAAEIAETVDNLYAFAATTNAVPSRHFDALFEATCEDPDVRAFLMTENPAAARSIAGRFAEALDRRLWRSRRNSVAGVLAEMLGHDEPDAEAGPSPLREDGGQRPGDGSGTHSSLIRRVGHRLPSARGEGDNPDV